MDEPIEELVDELGQQPAPKTNHGWFRPGDGRINRQGRPRGSKVVTADGTLSADSAKRADRVMLLFVNGKYLTHRLASQFGPWMRGIPCDAQIIDCRVDAERKGVVLTIRSDEFPRIAKGATIPELKPEFNGLKWRGSKWLEW